MLHGVPGFLRIHQLFKKMFNLFSADIHEFSKDMEAQLKLKAD